MNLEDGMYVRLDRNQGIARIDEIDNIWINIDKEIYDEWAEETFTVKETDILKASHSLLGDDKEPCLIEIGDYVNGYPVVEITNHQILGKIVCTKSPRDWNINEEKIKSILTKEQFEALAYKVN